MTDFTKASSFRPFAGALLLGILLSACEAPGDSQWAAGAMPADAASPDGCPSAEADARPAVALQLDAGAACKLKDGETCTTSTECAGGSCLKSYRDADGDGWGGEAVQRCESAPQPGYVFIHGDCCDVDPVAHPGSEAFWPTRDLCRDYDWDCDGSYETKTVCSPSPYDTSCATWFR